MKPSISIRLFGRFSVRLGEGLLLDQIPQKAEELLAYLILHPGKAHPRDSLAELLWGERDTPNSRKYLRQVLWQLHSGLVSLGRARAASLLRAESDWLELALDDCVDVDVNRFEEAFAVVKAARGETLDPAQARAMMEAAQLYRGDLLEGWLADWCDYDRERFRRMYLSFLDKLADYFESNQEYEAAAAYAVMALRHDRARERSHRSLMRALAMSGDRCGAIRQFTRCREALRDELAVEPEPETIVLEQMIRAGQVVGAVRERLAGTGGGGSGSSVRGLSVVPASRRSAGARARQA